ncbi:uncharacterized protein LOC110701670 [Chenopodium quinoa]|uniref:uncharacterized protein LOC110701670 n=1 Tax=Chenopodium quinoa TaxID=63459 RepID=UPI000B76C667|nr:uncharacterized protein LOC110701670 [Chenopodium quinoa]
MRVFLEKIDVAYVLDDIVESVDGDDLSENDVKFAKDDRTSKGMLLHYMSNNLLDIYMSFYHARDIWDDLEKKYGTDDASTKRYCVSKWLSFQVVDDKPIIDQIHAYENVYINMAAEEELVGHLKIEEENRIKDKGPSIFPSSSSAKSNLVEPKHNNQSKANNSSLKPKGKVQKYKFKGTCFECGFTGQKAKDCRVTKKNKNGQSQENLIEDYNVIVAVIS